MVWVRINVDDGQASVGNGHSEVCIGLGLASIKRRDIKCSMRNLPVFSEVATPAEIRF